MKMDRLFDMLKEVEGIKKEVKELLSNKCELEYKIKLFLVENNMLDYLDVNLNRALNSYKVKVL